MWDIFSPLFTPLVNWKLFSDEMRKVTFPPLIFKQLKHIFPNDKAFVVNAGGWTRWPTVVLSNLNDPKYSDFCAESQF